MLTGLIEEAALFEEAPALLGRDLHALGGDEKDLVGHRLHRAGESIGEAAREVDQAPSQLWVDRLQVHQHAEAVAELVADLLGVVERGRLYEMDALRHRRRRGRAHQPWLRSVAIGVGKPPDVRPARAGWGLVGLRVVVALVVEVLFLGEPQVHERLSPHACHGARISPRCLRAPLLRLT